MKKYLFPQEGQFYKANLHAHTTCSDGHLSPEEAKRAYQNKGYSVFAFTDHDVFLAHDELKDDGFLPLHGYEVEILPEGPQPFGLKKTCHLCFIALDADNLTPVCLNRTKYYLGNGAQYKDQMQWDDQPDYVRQYTPECINDMIQRARRAGFYVTYNHPAWSTEDYRDYSRYEGMNALEIYNGGCISEGYDDRNGRVYDDMLRQNKRVAVTASDDNHNEYLFGDPHCDSFIAWTMIKAEKLDYPSVAKALLNGDYYASMGPEIRSLYVEDGLIKVECSEARRINFISGVRHNYAEIDPEGKLTFAQFAFRDTDQYVRVVVTDKNGYTAESRAYFIDELTE